MGWVSFLTCGRTFLGVVPLTLGRINSMAGPQVQIADCVAVFVPNKRTAPQSPCKYSANYRRGNLGLNKVAGQLMQIADCVAVFVPNKGTAPQSPCRYSANYRRGNLGLNKVAGPQFTIVNEEPAIRSAAQNLPARDRRISGSDHPHIHPHNSPRIRSRNPLRRNHIRTSGGSRRR